MTNASGQLDLAPQALVLLMCHIHITLEKSMTTISLKMSETLAIRLQDAARERGVSKSVLIRNALEVYLESDGVEKPKSALSQAVDLAGVLSGAEDLSTNKDYLGNFGR